MSAASSPHTAFCTTTAATLACMWEAQAEKLGNVTPTKPFSDARFEDFVTSAVVSAPLLAEHATRGVGGAIAAAAAATHRAVGHNTNLGTLLLLGPLVAAAELPASTWEARLATVLARLDQHDTEQVFAAICLAEPAGLGTSRQADVRGKPPAQPLPQVMALAAERDTIARQYANNFADVLAIGQRLCEDVGAGASIEQALRAEQVRVLASMRDSLIERKLGLATAERIRLAAEELLDLQTCQAEAATAKWGELDRFLRDPRHRRNPGTTADLLAAGLFLLLRSESLAWPLAFSDR